MILSYNEMLHFTTFEERLEYLSLPGKPSEETFGQLRFLNQRLYTSTRWRELRRHIIYRDGGNDLAIRSKHIYGSPIIHHINPIKPRDLLSGNPIVFDPNNLVCVSDQTHRAIHYGYIPIEIEYVERKEGDTKLWGF